MSDPAPRAVFLSYAREDSAAARRIADALRSGGVEVWFDEDELRGGDAWDQTIRRQVRECGLFLPVISARTEERGEGYFRREWKLAAERTHDMAEGMPFLVPVAIDDTPESGAAVPEPFLQVQWMRLPGALPTPAFVEQVRRLLAAPRRPATSTARANGRDTVSGPARPTGWPRGILAGLGLGAIALLVFLEWRPEEPKPAVTAPPAQATMPAAAAAPVREVTDKSIAVLPFANLSPDKENEFFADGMHEDILTNLARIRELRVISRFSVMEYRGKTGNLREIARKLGVAYVLEGSVRRADNRVRVTSQLIRAATDEHLWAETITRDLSDVFAIQSELARKIAASLHAVLTPAEKRLIERRPTRNAVAYDLYLKARELYMNQSTPGEAGGRNREQAALLEAAVRLDPGFAAAWSQLATILSFAALSQYPLEKGETVSERLKRARQAIETAVQLAPDAPETALGLGHYHYHGFRDYAKAIEQFERVRQLAPSSPDWSVGLGSVYRRQGRWIDAIELYRRTIEIDPGNLYITRQLANTLLAGRRYEEALAIWQRLAEARPDGLDAATSVARTVWRATGRTETGDEFFRRMPPAVADSRRGLEARKSWALSTGRLAEYQRLERIKPNDWPDGTEFQPGRGWDSALVSAALGQRAEVRTKITNWEELRTRVAAQPDSPQAWRDLAEVEALVGDAVEAVRCARRAVELLPESRDALAGPPLSRALAFVYAWTGDKDCALAEYARLLRVPYSRLNVHEMRTSPDYLPLRGDPRFEALLNDPKNNAPLF